jgi:anti-sigma-K factor RskA
MNLNPIEAIAKMVRGLMKDLLKVEIREAAREAIAETEEEFRLMVGDARQRLLPMPADISTDRPALIEASTPASVRTNGRAKRQKRSVR